ncbi:MAG TPA: nucleotidyltransferase family protein [Dyella sp.]|uniref:nucleotidyltransferase family protein n=1 Tax=Dyella sp. TaxID=1869338 RepID=UPI002F9573FD
MLPPLKVIKRGLRRTTEALAAELALARPGSDTPPWSDLEWRLAAAATAAHGIAPLLSRDSTWQHATWQRFLAEQRAHVEDRYRRIADLLERIDTLARTANIAIVPLKGSALHALGLYAPGERPMADIDLLVRPEDVDRAGDVLQKLGYAESFRQWKHRVFKPETGQPIPCLGEHRDTPVNIELHTRILERLPVASADVTAQVFPRDPQPGLNPYPSHGALMSHLLLHAAGNICTRSARLMHLNDISLLATRMAASDWDLLWSGQRPWWAFAPLQLVARYYRNAIPAAVLRRAARDCPPLLRAAMRRQTLTRVSCSELWLHPLAGLEWSRSAGDIIRYMRNRLRPSQEAKQERADMLRTQLWLQGQSWVRQSHVRRAVTWLTRPVPRMDTMYVVRAALGSKALSP